MLHKKTTVYILNIFPNLGEKEQNERNSFLFLSHNFLQLADLILSCLEPVSCKLFREMQREFI